jgi:hypothetical protein
MLRQGAGGTAPTRGGYAGFKILRWASVPLLIVVLVVLIGLVR